MQGRAGLLTELNTAFARFEGMVSTEIRNLAHDVKNLSAALGGYATTKDLSAVEKRLEERIVRIESANTWLTRTLVGAVFGGVVSVLVWAVKGGHL